MLLVLALILPLSAQTPPAPAAPPEPLLALRVATVHPISSPPIADGVIVLRGQRIAAVGAADRVAIPPGARVLEHPHAHAYPGLVDALSTAFADRRVLEDTATDAGSAIIDGLDPFDPVGRSVIAAGITTAFVGTLAATRWRGQGALVRPTAQGFGLLDAPRGAAIRLWLDGEDQHPLVRQKELRAVASVFESLELYEQQKKRAADAAAAYERKFAAYLDWHRKHKDSGSGGEQAGEPGDGAPAERGNGDGAPRKPAYPRAQRDDPAKEALLGVRTGTSALRVEARHRDTIEGILQLAGDERIARLVIENPRDAAPIASRLRDAGVAVVVAGLGGDDPAASGHDPAPLAAALARAGVSVCIASGDSRSSRHLPLLAAQACSQGLDPQQAERAITLEAARVLGIDDQVGSLEPGKLGDVVITDGPLLATGTRILRVVAGGTSWYEAKP